MIPFNQPCLTGKEAHYMYQAVYNKKLSGEELSKEEKEVEYITENIQVEQSAKHLL